MENYSPPALWTFGLQHFTLPGIQDMTTEFTVWTMNLPVWKFGINIKIFLNAKCNTTPE
jgi:hypothetical protein